MIAISMDSSLETVQKGACVAPTPMHCVFKSLKIRHSGGFDQARLFVQGGEVQRRSETRQVHANVKLKKKLKKGETLNQP